MTKRDVSIDVKLTPLELAQEFCDMDGDEQAMFLNFIAQLSSQWDRPLEFQIQNIVDSNNFLSGANRVMKLFGEYAEEARQKYYGKYKGNS